MDKFFFFKFILRYQQSDIFPIIFRYQQHHRYWGQNLPPVSLVPVVHLEFRKSPRIFEKFRNGPNVISRAWGT
jgi:hypothetical protein